MYTDTLLSLPDGVYHNLLISPRIDRSFAFCQIVDGKLHCEVGPIIEVSETSGNIIMWFFEGVEYSFELWCKFIALPEEDKLFLKLKYLNLPSRA
jgi:hypothetical protein